MKTIRVIKEDLITTLTENRDAHRAEFEKAQVRYRERVIETMDSNLAEARAGHRLRTYIDLPEPVDYTRVYDTALQALAWEVGDEVELDQREFDQLVLNNWSWVADFASNTQAYTVGELR